MLGTLICLMSCTYVPFHLFSSLFCVCEPVAEPNWAISYSALFSLFLEVCLDLFLIIRYDLQQMVLFQI
jgi:hypothetical protein